MDRSHSALTTVLVAAFLAVGHGATVRHRRELKWSYLGPNKPDEWSGICKSGEAQSPIDIIRSHEEKHLSAPSIYGKEEVFKLKLKNNGHSIYVSLADTYITMVLHKRGGAQVKYTAHSFHFHWGTKDGQGSEHLVGGKPYEAELHIVFTNSKYTRFEETLENADGLAVVGVMLEGRTGDNRLLDPITENLKRANSPHHETEIELKLSDLIGDSCEHIYRYQGSLTTPPCSEVVTWTVCAKPQPIGRKQLDGFRKVQLHSSHMENNFRPVQDLNCRKVYRNFKG